MVMVVTHIYLTTFEVISKVNWVVDDGTSSNVLKLIMDDPQLLCNYSVIAHKAGTTLSLI